MSLFKGRIPNTCFALHINLLHCVLCNVKSYEMICPTIHLQWQTTTTIPIEHVCPLPPSSTSPKYSVVLPRAFSWGNAPFSIYAVEEMVESHVHVAAIDECVRRHLSSQVWKRNKTVCVLYLRHVMNTQIDFACSLFKLGALSRHAVDRINGNSYSKQWSIQSVKPIPRNRKPKWKWMCVSFNTNPIVGCSQLITKQ